MSAHHFYGTSLSYWSWVTYLGLYQTSPIETVPACPMQIRSHHHIDVYADINKYM